jgi:HlyD family secretion protein
MAKFFNLPRLRWVYVVAAIAAALGTYVASNWWRGPVVPVETVLRRDFVQTVVASGHVESPYRVDIGSQITSTVTRIPVGAGDMVRAQDVLIELAAAELLAAERQSVDVVTQARAKLRQLTELQAPVAEQALRQAQTNLHNAQATLLRNESLRQQGFVGEASLDDSRKAVDLADSQVHAALKQVETTRPSGSDYAMAASALKQAEAAADGADSRARYAVIRAPVDGTLIGRSVEVGDVVQPGKVLMTLSPKGKTQLALAIDEKNLRLMALGQKAVVSADAYPQQKFDATLVYINPGVNAQTGSVDVKLDIDNPPDFLRQDMTVSVDIEVARRAQTLLLSTLSLHEADSGNPWVLRIDNGVVVKSPVKLGLRGGGFAEVLAGLSEGDAVVSGASSLALGARARAKADKP